MRLLLLTCPLLKLHYFAAVPRRTVCTLKRRSTCVAATKTGRIRENAVE